MTLTEAVRKFPGYSHLYFNYAVDKEIEEKYAFHSFEKINRGRHRFVLGRDMCLYDLDRDKNVILSGARIILRLKRTTHEYLLEE